MQKIIELANSISGVDLENPKAHKEGDPAVSMLAAVIDDDLAAVALMCTKKPMTAQQIADQAGVPVEYIEEKLKELGQKGILFFEDYNDGLTYYNRVPWAPGICEHLIVYPATRNVEVAKYFDEYGFQRGVMSSYKVPRGAGFMRVIPIGKSIEAMSRTATYEEIQTYLDHSDSYSVTDCACRTAKKFLGEACEHPIEDTCIQIGPEADYYVRTGRARKVTRKEVEEILLKAEQEGLVHEIFNNEGVNQSSFICNCCGCSCSVLRRASLMRCTDYSRSNFVAKVDSEKCVACGACVEVCNTNALILGDTLTGKKPEHIEETPFDHEWGEDKWDKDFRKRRMVAKSGTSPCKTKCPAHISIQGYIQKAAQGKYDEALKVIKRDNPFPAVCGRICPHTCESECTRGTLDEALAIDDIKRFIADIDLKAEDRYLPVKVDKYSEKVAVIGGGPSGLSCAYYLAVQGYSVTVFDKNPRAGGMLTMGIPAFRLDRDVIEAEIEIIRKLGVIIKTGVEVGKDITIDDLRKDGYKAFYIAIGAQGGRKLGIEGEDAKGVVSGVQFLSQLNLSNNSQLEGNTIVIGGGNVAIDVARSAVRVCNGSVGMFCLESETEMPALPEEREAAALEGIEINHGWGPKRILVRDGAAVGIEFKKCISVFDEGRFNPKYDENNTIIVEADNILVSIGQSIEWGELLEGSKMKTGRGNTVQVQEISFQTDEQDIFAGGDVATGPKFAIDAIASGKQGATSIHRYLRGRGLTMRREREYNPFDRKNLELAGYDRMPRQKTETVDFASAKKTFRDVRKTLTEEQIKKETNRCLGCGITYVDEYMCIGCGVCATRCEFDAIKLVRKYDAPSMEPELAQQAIREYTADREKRLQKK